MVAGKDDDGILALAGFIEALNDACELVIDEGNHGVVKGLNFLGPALLGSLRFGLEIDWS